MSRHSIRVERLAEMARPHSDWRRHAEETWQLTHIWAVEHAAVLAFVTLVGDPSIEEPLSAAWQRCKESETWTRCCKEFHEWVRGPRFRSIHAGISAKWIGSVLRYMVIAELPGADEKEKLNTVFAAAPPWLLYFCFADYTAKLLNLTLPDLSTVRRFERSRADCELWPSLPGGMFERRPWPNGPEGEPLAYTDLKLPGQPMEPDLRGMMPRQLKRALATYMNPQEYQQTWPPRWPIEYLRNPDEFVKRLRQGNDQRLREA